MVQILNIITVTFLILLISNIGTQTSAQNDPPTKLYQFSPEIGKGKSFEWEVKNYFYEHTFEGTDRSPSNFINTDNQFSSILKIKVDFNNRQINETFMWTPSDNYFSGFWGGSRMLQNGNLFGIFGSTFHKSNTEFGGVAIEVNNEVEVSTMFAFCVICFY